VVDTSSAAPDITRALAKQKADERAAKPKPEWLRTSATGNRSPPGKRANPFTRKR